MCNTVTFENHKEVYATAEDKERFRNIARSLRRDLPSHILKVKSRKIYARLRAISWFTNAQNILIYASLPVEVDTENIIQNLLSEGKNVILPYTLPNGNMEAYQINKFPDDLKVKEGHRILEPVPEKCKFIKPEEIDCIILPGLAFDRDGHRIGFGKGCYDIYMENIKEDIPIIALAFEFQIYHKVPTTKTDRPVNMIITESNVFYPKKRIFEINSPEEMIEWGKSFGLKLESGETISMIGDLGSGKTTLAKGILEGYGVSDQVTSPTFIQIESYFGRGPIYHMDLYRWSEDSVSLEQKMLLDQIIDEDAVVLVEWADRVLYFLPKSSIGIKLDIIEDQKRKLTLTTYKPTEEVWI